MQVNYRVYPHPVLSYFSDDYVRCLYQTNVLTSVSRTTYQFAVTSKTSSPGLLKLLEAGDAVHGIHIECNATRYRRIFTSKDDRFSVEISSDELDGRVNLCSFIVAARNIDYASEEFHPDFGGRTFKIRKGDVLAVDKDRTFIAEKEYDPLRKLPSIFRIMPNLADNPPPIDINLTGHKIVIYLSDEMHRAYKKLAVDTATPHILSSMIIVPALISLLETISSGSVTEFEERRWYRVLSNKLKEHGYSIEEGSSGFNDSTLVIAQKLLGNPLLLGTRALITVLEYSGDEEE
ncbi:hypothetical protein [Herbaspirillum sp. RV1423]|uniref:hypothetical protein n=1 Tax=Herbaspirillum sp. RV1423 TaxID=1443993 RepID=UPI0012DD474F|nr:hypothetical protein [Herbaspirillum sp. RV1423]